VCVCARAVCVRVCVRARAVCVRVCVRMQASGRGAGVDSWRAVST
jgi:hypothetical protein